MARWRELDSERSHLAAQLKGCRNDEGRKKMPKEDDEKKYTEEKGTGEMFQHGEKDDKPTEHVTSELDWSRESREPSRKDGKCGGVDLDQLGRDLP